MNSCDEFEMLASAFVDDELDRDETVSLLDHLATCESCRFFYRQARALEGALVGAPVAAVLPPDAWRKIESRARQATPAPAWGLRAAAGFLVAFLAWQVSHVQVAPLVEPRPIEVALEESKGVMDDSRFIELTSEILRADRRYHAAMLQVMNEVNAATGVSRTNEESTSSENESEETGGESNQREVAS
jgi:hypothetical protein